MSKFAIAFCAIFALAAPALSRAAELVMVERTGCVYCTRWDREVAPTYEKTEEGRRAPLRRVSLDEGQPMLQLKAPVRFTPTFILADNGRELGRLTGYMNDAMFWGLLGDLLQRLETAPRPDSRP